MYKRTYVCIFDTYIRAYIALHMSIFIEIYTHVFKQKQKKMD